MTDLVAQPSGGVVNRPYQNECLRANVRAMMAGLTRGINAMPTASGKTIVFAQLARWMAQNGLLKPDHKVVVLAHRDELIEQARTKLLRVNPAARIGIERGSESSHPDDTYVLASVQTIGRKDGKRLAELSRRNVGLIITDECHHALASTYQRIYGAFDKATHVGFTATPFRGDRQSLASVYEEVFYEVKLRLLMEQGYLARARIYKQESGSDISGVHLRQGEYASGELEEAVNTASRNTLVVQSHLEFGEGERSLVFAAGIQHGIDITNRFIDHGIPAAFIDGNTNTDERRAKLRAFHDGKIRVLVNVGVFTEGFDEPLIKNVILARPTRSPLLYAQQVGRAFRKPERNEVDELTFAKLQTANIIDIADSGRKAGTMNMLSMFGIEKDVKCRGEDALEIVRNIMDLDARGVQCESVEDIKRFTIDENFHDIPVLDKMVKKSSAYAWQRMSDGSFFLPIPGKNKAQVSEDMLGRVVLSTKIEGKNSKEILGTGKPEDHIKKADERLRKCAPKDPKTGESILSKVEWFWMHKKFGKMPATGAQLGALQKFRVKHKPGLTKGEASLLLSRVIANIAADRYEKI